MESTGDKKKNTFECVYRKVYSNLLDISPTRYSLMWILVKLSHHMNSSVSNTNFSEEGSENPKEYSKIPKSFEGNLRF